MYKIQKIQILTSICRPMKAKLGKKKRYKVINKNLGSG